MRFFRLSTGALEPLALACTAQIDSREEHGQLRRLEFDAVLAGRVGHLVASRLEAFVPDGQPVAIEVEDLDPISAAVEEKEEVAGQRVLSEALLNQSGETVEAFA
jgi:predicted component of type VI protein secretion system